MTTRHGSPRKVTPALRKARGLSEISKIPDENRPEPFGACECPETFDDDLKFIWRRYVDRCYWLTTVDETKAIVWCILRREFLADPAKMIAARIRELRMLGGELGMDPDSRTRINTGGKKPQGQFDKFT